MKKLFLTISILAGLIFSYGVSAAISYERSPAGSQITSPVSFEISFDDFSEICPDQESNYYGIGTDSVETQGIIASTTLSHVFVLDMPLGGNDDIYSECSIVQGIAGEFGIFLEQGSPAFEILYAASNPLASFAIGEDFNIGIFDYVKAFFSDLRNIIFLLIGLPLGIWIANIVIGFFGKLRGKKVK